ncbi:HPr family phosphocarrier protein [Paenibacillus aceris]|uniref:Phosphotransferase system HPr (HPr) family protein n=1 Tax=Paenibacillus aceris TaxID=869555 RepID=A0ABS4HSK0_9BACL|nr:HPr family phosphocarrier protein [Paenibacillus aceris]MBP1961568.1 phosphotransferase system HPr (HPr) family protein [Paenibacillus aceris]NHW37658.1 hypothetical protein [Paenibacillus aceris]
MKIEWSFEMNRLWSIEQVLNFVAMANRFSSQIYVGTKGKMLNAKGVLGVVSFSLTLGSNGTIMLQVEGTDSQEAFTAVSLFLQNEVRRQSPNTLPSSYMHKHTRVAQ